MLSRPCTTSVVAYDWQGLEQWNNGNSFTVLQNMDTADTVSMTGKEFILFLLQIC